MEELFAVEQFNRNPGDDQRLRVDSGHGGKIWHGKGDDVHYGLGLGGNSGCAVGINAVSGDDIHHHTGRNGQQPDKVYLELKLRMDVGKTPPCSR